MVDKIPAPPVDKVNFWNVLKWFVICSFTVLIVIIIIANVTPRPSRTSTPEKTEACPLQCTQDDILLAKTWYETKGPFQGQTITTGSASRTSPTECTISYRYPSADKTTTIGNTRKFTYTTGCNKQVTAMSENLKLD